MNEEIKLLKQIISIYSPSGKENELVIFLAKYLAKKGFQTSIDKSGNLYAEIGSGKIKILLATHLDTVTGKLPIKTIGNKIYGRGVVDAKGTLACFIFAVLKAIEKTNNKKIIIAFLVEEETGSLGAQSIKENVSPDYVIIGEPSSVNQITFGYKGAISIKVVSQEIVAHQSIIKNISLLDQLFYFHNNLIKTIKTINQNKQKIEQQINILPIKIATIKNIKNKKMSIVYDVRLPISFNIDEFKQTLNRLNKKTKTQLIIGKYTPAYKANFNNKLVATFVDCIYENLLIPKLVFKSGTSDMNVLGPKYQVPIVAYGPGDSILDHTADESLSLIEYKKAINILSNVLINL